jgi:hypothetical protein
MRSCKITVWDYEDKLHGITFPANNRKQIKPGYPIGYEVEAWCVGGDEGIKAFFFIDNMFCMANGDDGHWWFVDRCHENWLEEIKDAINAACAERIFKGTEKE